METRCRGSAPDAEKSPEVDGSSARKRERVERREGKVPGEQKGDGDIARLVTGTHGGKHQETALHPSLRSGNKALKGRNAPRESGLAPRGNVVNPRVVSRAQQTGTMQEEKAVEVVGNHEDGTRSELAAPVRR